MSRKYIGTELDIFAKAANWKKYSSAQLHRFISGEVAEIGAGFGGTTPYLITPASRRWLCLEPDEQLFHRLQRAIAQKQLPAICLATTGTLAELPAHVYFDTILYIDVLEHIKDDRGELAIAGKHLRPGGHMVVLAPAWMGLFSEFDSAIGHFRRYSASSLISLTPPDCSVVATFYLDSVGGAASLTNRWLLRTRHPTPGQIALWDNFMVPLSRLFDPLTGRRIGKTVVVAWRKRL